MRPVVSLAILSSPRIPLSLGCLELLAALVCIASLVILVIPVSLSIEVNIDSLLALVIPAVSVVLFILVRLSSLVSLVWLPSLIRMGLGRPKPNHNL